MTNVEYDRWRDFSLRMAKTAYPRATEVRQQKIYNEVLSYLEEIKSLKKYYPDSFAKISGWDSLDSVSRVDDFFDNYYHWSDYECTDTGKFLKQITCCLRAGIDVAAEPSGGVIGFDVGMIRRMYDGNVPDWVTQLFEGNFNEFSDDDGVWL